jgi:hypothetical protein
VVGEVLTLQDAARVCVDESAAPRLGLAGPGRRSSAAAPVKVRGALPITGTPPLPAAGRAIGPPFVVRGSSARRRSHRRDRTIATVSDAMTTIGRVRVRRTAR